MKNFHAHLKNTCVTVRRKRYLMQRKIEAANAWKQTMQFYRSDNVVALLNYLKMLSPALSTTLKHYLEFFSLINRNRQKLFWWMCSPTQNYSFFQHNSIFLLKRVVSMKFIDDLRNFIFLHSY